MKNQWMDDEGRAYIYYSLEDIMEALGCSNKKAISIMKELDTDAGIGLIEKKRQGQGKPTMIYLKQFMVQDVQKCRNFTSEQKVAVSEVKNLHVLKCKNVISRSEEITLPEVKNIHTNKNNINNTELSNTDSSIHPGAQPEEVIEGYRKEIRKNIEYDHLCREFTTYREDLDEIVELMVETVCAKRKTTRIAGSDFPHEVVRSRFLKLDSEHIRFVMDSLQKNTTEVRNMKQYLLTVLFNAPTTISNHYTSQVNHDMNADGW